MAEPTPVTPAEPAVKAESVEQPTFVHPLDMLDAQESEDIVDPGQTTEAEALEPAPITLEVTPTETISPEPIEQIDVKPPVVETKPDATEPEKPKRPQFWKQMREAKKSLAEREREITQREAKLQEQPPVKPEPQLDEFGLPRESEIDDPLTKMGRDLEETKRAQKELDARYTRQQDQLEQQRREQAIQERILQQERQFAATNPDYNAALSYLVQTREEEYDEMGMIDQQANQWLAHQEELVRRHAVETGKNPQDDDQLYEAARDIAARVLIDAERRRIIDACTTVGKSVPEAIYNLATRRGYKAPAAEIVKPETSTPQQKVRTAMATQAVTQSLSAVRNNGVPQTRQIKTREDVMNLTDAEMLELDAKTPGWDKAIFGS